ncbi:hypothetical protein ACWCSD_39170, partial [Nonomuraea sp. NPDC001684]
ASPIDTMPNRWYEARQSYHWISRGNVRDSTTSSFIDNVFKGNGHDPSGLTDEAGLPVRGAIHIGRRSSPITLTGNVGKHNDGYFVWITPPSGAIDGGGNRGRPCGPQPPPLTCH